MAEAMARAAAGRASEKFSGFDEERSPLDFGPAEKLTIGSGYGKREQAGGPGEKERSSLGFGLAEKTTLGYGYHNRPTLP